MNTSNLPPIDIREFGRSKLIADIDGALIHLHNSFFKHKGGLLFGDKMKSLKRRTTFAGSSFHLFNSIIPDIEFLQYKPLLGDIDVQVPKEYASELFYHLSPGRIFGKYCVISVNRGGCEIHVIFQHRNGDLHQIDFECVDYQSDEPTPFCQFSHSSAWTDIKLGIKGAHHKQLLNAVAGETQKFSAMYGVGYRSGDVSWTSDLQEICYRLFSTKDAILPKLRSFCGTIELIKTHINEDTQKKIFDKFAADAFKKDKEVSAATKLLKSKLDITQSPNHVSVIPLVGFVPFSHMGHKFDLGDTLKFLPGKKFVGVSDKCESPERFSILKKQWQFNFVPMNVSSAGETIRAAYDSLPENQEKVLHLLLGHDRQDMAKKLKRCLEMGKIKEMGDKKFDAIFIHYPKQSDRPQKMSGTKFREAALNTDIEEFHSHLGPMFSVDEAYKYMIDVNQKLLSGQIFVKRKR